MENSTIRTKLMKESNGRWQVSEGAIQRFRESLPNILSLVNEKFRLETPYAENQAISHSLDFLMDAHGHFGEMLLAIYQFQLWHSLVDEVMWYAQSVRSRGLDERYLSQMLKTWMIALHIYVKPPEVNELTQPLAWLSSHVQDLFQSEKQVEELSHKASELMNLLFANERDKAEELVNSFFEENKSEELLINQLLLPVLWEIGKLWCDNRISVADEHLAVANLRMIYQSFFRSRLPDERKEQKITVCCVPGEEHEAGAELLSLYLQSKGWHMIFIGHSTPEGEILRMVEQNTPFALILSVTLISHLPALVSLAQKLRERFSTLKILAGGNAVRQDRVVIQKLVDGVPDSFEDCNRMLNDMVNIHA